MTNLYTLVQRLQSLVPSLSYHNADWEPNQVTLHVASGCAGTIERAWPQVWALCEELDCEPAFEWHDTLKQSMKLDDPSAAPKFQTRHTKTITLTLALRASATQRKENAA